jgi:hypothetical protein
MTATATPTRPAFALPRTGLTRLLVAAFGVALGLLIMLTILLTRSGGSDYLTVDQEVSGQLTKISSDGTAIAMDTADGQLATRLVNPTEFDIQPGDTLIGTLVHIPLEDGGSGEALVVYAVTSGS